MTSNILRESILVVAHPDDEALWFSSILRKVNQIIICYSDELTDPEFGAQRIKSLLNFPLENVSCLDLASVGVMRPKSFVSPKFNQYGIELVGKDNPEHSKKYQENYYELRRRLVHTLSQYQNVITHNPWGEYGHVEHVQVYRVVHELQTEAGFNLWHSSYCSTKTLHLLSQCLHVEEMITLPTDGAVANKLIEHYKAHKVWTWVDDWCWPATETFVKEKSDTLSSTGSEESRFCIFNSTVPLNLILMSSVSQPFQEQHPSIIKRLMKFIQKVVKGVRGS